MKHSEWRLQPRHVNPRIQDTHCVVAALCSQYAKTAFYSEKLWNSEIVEKLNIPNGTKMNNEGNMPSYATLENRTKQFDAVVEVIFELLNIDSIEKIQLLQSRIQKYFYLLYVTYWNYLEEFSQYNSWIEIGCYMYVHCEKCVTGRIENENWIKIVLNELDECFFKYISAENEILNNDEDMIHKYLGDIKVIAEALDRGDSLSEAIRELALREKAN